MDTVLLRDRLIHQAKAFGADDAGVCLASDLLNGSSHRKFPRPEGLLDHHYLLVIALRHPFHEPALDYFIRKDGARYGNSEGNRRLMRISDGIGRWLDGKGLTSRDLHYYVERGGVFLKGAAVLAGLGTIGANNLLIHPRFGARVRFRAHLLDFPLTSSVSIDFNPCLDCGHPCLTVCPERALDSDGFTRDKCRIQLDRDISNAVTLPGEADGLARREVHYCRICEFSCIYTGGVPSHVKSRR
ncbi:MAG: hypothetical protein GXP52_09875 [Deltaproteobacteria bacterium]|nr:hypothetical protein [Deltaproteobacteria bacterium]